MESATESNERDYIDDASFPILEGQKMCPRCTCCLVRVARWVLEARYYFIGPDGHDHPDARNAWVCVGGCDQHGKHTRDWRWARTLKRLPASAGWTFIGWVKKV